MLRKGERVLAGLSGTAHRSESPEMREKGQFVHASNVPDINSSSMERVLTGVSPARSSDTTDDPFVWSPEKQVLSR